VTEGPIFPGRDRGVSLLMNSMCFQATTWGSRKEKRGVGVKQGGSQKRVVRCGGVGKCGVHQGGWDPGRGVWVEHEGRVFQKLRLNQCREDFGRAN